MRTELLEAFAVVAEERHFGRAAERLHIGQSPLSQQIRRLEREVGTPLFDRTTRNVSLTPAGVALQATVGALLRDIEAAQVNARRAASGELGQISIGFTGAATFSIMPGLVKCLRDAVPDVGLDLHGELLTPGQVRRLVDGSLDLGLLRPPVHAAELAVEVVRQERLLALLPAGHSLADEDEIEVEQLADSPFVVYPSAARSVLYAAVERICEKHGFKPNVRMEVGETATLVSFVASGIGVSLVPETVASLKIDGVVYRPLAGGDAWVELALAWRREDANPLLARVLDLVREHLNAGLRSG